MSKMPPFDWREWATKSSNWAGQDANLAFEDFIERKWQDAINIAATEPATWKGEVEKAAGRTHVPDKVHGGDKGAVRLTGAVNTIEQQEGSRPPSPHWNFSFRKKCRARNLIGCDGNHVILKCEKLHGMKLAERKEVVEKSGLCTFCLRHGADVECYAKGGLSKPRCERLGCDGEHVTGLHTLLGEADAAVNLVAGDEGGVIDAPEGEYNCQDEWAGDGSWNDDFEATGRMEGSEGLTYSHTNEDTALCADMAEAGDWEYESLWVGTISAVELPGRASDVINTTTGRGPSQEDGRDGAEEETTEDECEQCSQETGQAGGAADTLEEPSCKPARRFNGGQTRKPHPHLRTSGRPGPRTRPEQTGDQQWEEARHNAWLRQLLSDDSSDGSDEEERYGRFAESGRWISELYGIPQYPTTTLGRECSA
jgi:hypothetical protein